MVGMEYLDFKKKLRDHTMDPILTLPTTAVGDIMAFAGELFTNTWALIAVAIGLPVAFWVVNKLIGMVRGGLRARN